MPHRCRIVTVAFMAGDLDLRRSGELVRNGDWFRWPDDAGDWSLRLRWAEVDGLVECVGLEAWRGARPDPRASFDCPNPECGEKLDYRAPTKFAAHRGGSGPQPISSLRDLPIGQIVRQQRADLDLDGESFDYSVDLGTEEWPADRDDQWPYVTDTVDARAPGRPRLPALHYLEVAQVYIHAEANGDPPTAAVMDRFTLSRRGAGRALAEAQRLGFLKGSGRQGATRQKGPNYREAPRPFLGRDGSHVTSRRAERPTEPMTKKGR